MSIIIAGKNEIGCNMLKYVIENLQRAQNLCCT